WDSHCSRRGPARGLAHRRWGVRSCVRGEPPQRRCRRAVCPPIKKGCRTGLPESEQKKRKKKWVGPSRPGWTSRKWITSLLRNQRHPLDHILVRSRRHRVRNAFQYDVRLGRPSVFGPLDRRRCIFGIALWCTAVDPLHDRVDILLLQRPVIRKMTVLRIGEPG